MLISLKELLGTARDNGFALGAFNVYNLEGALAVIRAAESVDSPVILQVLPSALEIGGDALIALCRTAAGTARVPAAVHLDHCNDRGLIWSALEAGVSSVMADGSALTFDDNCRFTRKIAELAQKFGALVEGELGFLAGSEDGKTVAETQAHLTQPHQAGEFVQKAGISALAVCIGNRHGKYPETPELDFRRLEEIRKTVDLPLVLHGTSGLPDEMITRAVSFGVCKFNVNTEIRTAYMNQVRAMAESADAHLELVSLMTSSITAMQAPILSKITLFGSAGKAPLYKKEND